MSEENRSRFKSLAETFNASINIYEADGFIENIKLINHQHAQFRAEHLSDTALLRMFYAELIATAYEKLVYVDCDVVFTKDASRVFHVNLNDFIIGAAPDLITNSFLNKKEEPGYKYFNSGVLIIDDKKWRANGIQDKLSTILQEADPRKLRYADQDVLNLYFRKIGYQEISAKMNYQYMVGKETMYADSFIPLQEATVIHFAGEIKPWHEWAPKEYSDLYSNFRNLSPWKTGYALKSPSGFRQLVSGYQSLINQERFSEATQYGTKIIGSLQASLEEANKKRKKMDLLESYNDLYNIKRSIDYAVFLHLMKKFGNAVRHGPFAGMKYSCQPTWGDASLKLLGLYESCLHETMDEIQEEYQGYDVVDLGCAEGYYAAGLGMKLSSRHIIIRDIEDKSLEACKQILKDNCATAEVNSGGRTSSYDLKSILQRFPKSVVICDIEGAEAELFHDDSWCDNAGEACFVVEIHSFVDRTIRDTIISSSLSETHDFEFIKETDLRPSDIEELAFLDGLKRSMVCSECRPEAMEWLVAKPRSRMTSAHHS